MARRAVREGQAVGVLEDSGTLKKPETPPELLEAVKTKETENEKVPCPPPRPPTVAEREENRARRAPLSWRASDRRAQASSSTSPSSTILRSRAPIRRPLERESRSTIGLRSWDKKVYLSKKLLASARKDSKKKVFLSGRR